MKSALEKMMDLLARRAHSELELRGKLSLNYDESEIDEAIAKATASNWLQPPEELSESIAQELNQKRKGHEFINQYLEQKGLPPIGEDPELEAAKARELLQSKLKHDLTTKHSWPDELVQKAQRILAARGFSEETIRRVLS